MNPCFPHFSFNIRPGDSLVQEIGGMNLAQIHAAFSGVPSSLKARVTRLKTEKLKFFNNDNTRRFRSEKELKHEELQLFLALIDTHAQDLKQSIDDLQQLIDGSQMNNRWSWMAQLTRKSSVELELRGDQASEANRCVNPRPRPRYQRAGRTGESAGRFLCLGHRLRRNLHGRKGGI